MKFGTALKLGRVSNLPTVWTNCIAGAVLSGALVTNTTLDIRLLLVVLAMTLSYIGGMFLNDAFDATIDAIERPERPIPSGEISRQQVFLWGFGMLTLSVVLLACTGFIGNPIAAGVGEDSNLSRWRPAIAGLILALLIVFYNSYHKSNPLSPLVMGLCRVCVYAVAALACAFALAFPVYLGSALLLSYLIGLTYVAKQENLGSVKNAWPLLFLFAPLAYGLLVATGLLAPTADQLPVRDNSLAVLILWVLMLAWTFFCIYLIRRRSPGDIPRAVVSLIAGISLLDALLVASYGSVFLAIVCCAGFILTLLFQRYVSGT